MKRLIKLLLGFCVVLFAIVGCQVVRNSVGDEIPALGQDTLRIATYNVHYINMRDQKGAWSVGDWARRKAPLSQAVDALDADVIAFQEMESFAGRGAGNANLTLDWLLQSRSEFTAAAIGDPKVFPSTQPIFFRKDRLDLRDQGWFFFSETPDQIYSRTFNGSYPAFASWAVLHDSETAATFRVVNIHTDYRSRSNRLRSMELVAERITPWIAAGETVFVVGDFNARHGDATLDILTDVGIEFAPVQGSTFHFNRGLNLFGAIDHIGVAGRAKQVGAPAVLRQKFSGEWPTDHYPVIVDFAFE